jgi:transcriptional regulator with XRE-family HTH domain
MAVAATEARNDLGELLRRWRRLRGKSQLDLALDARTTQRHLSFVETGRAQPSRPMVVRLARALDVPLRERNELLLAAGYAPLYAAPPVDGPERDRARMALASMLTQHEPFPAVVMDRGWNVVEANAGAGRLFGSLLAPEPMPEVANVLELMIEPGPVRDAVLNWPEVVAGLFERCRREAVGGVVEAETAERLERLRAREDVTAVLDETAGAPSSAPVIDVAFAFDGVERRFFSVVSTIGVPAEVTAQELRVEAFFPSDEATREAWLRP